MTDLFFSSFQEIYNDNYSTGDIVLAGKILADFSSEKQTLDNLLILKPYAAQRMQKEQRPIKDHFAFYLANDVMTNTYYICFKELMMLDIDCHDNREISIQLLKDHCESHPDHLFHLFKTKNGLHAFLMSHKRDYKNLDHISEMISLGSDFFYCLNAHTRGWSIRLNRKIPEYLELMNPSNTDTKLIYEDLGQIGTGTVIPELQKLLAIHDFYVKKYNTTTPSHMP